MGGRGILHEMMSFTSKEVEYILLGVGIKQADLAQVLADVKDWYDGYLFCDTLDKERLYNPDMVLYFASEYVM